MREPDFGNLLDVLQCKAPKRPTLYEFIISNETILQQLTEGFRPRGDDPMLDHYRKMILAFRNAGYDYASVGGSDFRFPRLEIERRNTISINAGQQLHDRESFERFPWPHPDNHNYEILDKIARDIPDGMKGNRYYCIPAATFRISWTP